MHGTQPLYLNFDDGARGPTITCSANGYPRPAVEWIRENGRGLPSGIVQQDAPSSSSNGEVATQLRWRRDMEFTDSGFYVCRAFSNGGTYNATLELLVQRKYTCSTVYHYQSLLMFLSILSSTDSHQHFSLYLHHSRRLSTHVHVLSSSRPCRESSNMYRYRVASPCGGVA